MKSLKLWVLGCVMLFAGVQNASAALKGCEGTVYLKLPDGWTTAFTAGGGNFDAFTKSTKYPSWYEISTAKIGGTNSPDFFHISAARGDYGQVGGITRTQIGKNVQFQEATGFTCKDFGVKNELWIQPSFEDPTKPYVKGDPPDVKYFYVFLPDNKIWKSAVPMISEDGKDREMDIDNNNCGWYFRRYVDEPLPTKVFIHRDDDENLSNAIGFGGEKAANEGKAPDEINLQMLFDIYDQELGLEKKLYFVADEKKASELQGVDFGWYLTPPAITGSCIYFLAARIYDTDADLHPSFSCYKKDSRDNEEGCQGVGKQTAAQGVDLNTALAAIKACIGVTPGLVESTLDKATKKPKLTAAGKKCFMDEKYFNQLFNYTQGVNEVTCYDMPFTRADDGKWEFDSDFYTSGGLARAAQGGFYPAESTTVEKLWDADSNQVAVPTARTKRWAQGPVFYGPALRELHPTEKIPLIDTYCNGPGWSGGHKCDSLFADGDGTTAAVGSALHLMAPNDCVFGWSCPDKAPADWQFYAPGTDSAVAATATGADYRWDSDKGSVNGGRNQHFCFESHANFRFKKGLKFSFRGDDDIWVYIDNKLAVDLGGTHLAAPGYVDLDKFMPNAKPDSTYDIDIFFCDRRTTMSNVRIKTNMFIEQKTGILTSEFENGYEEYMLTGDNKIVLSYAQSGGGSCAAAMGSSVLLVGPEITKAGHKITYMFTRDKSGTDPTKIEVSEEQFEANPVQYGGAIDVTELYAPVINVDKLKSVLPPNTYYLRAKINSDVYIWPIVVEGSISVADRDAVIMNGGVASAPLKFKSTSIATTNDPAIEDLIPLYIAPSTDPCAGTPGCTDYLKLNPFAGASYSLEVKDTNGVDIGDRNLVSFYKLENGKLSPFNPKVSHVIGSGGVDTVYATIQYGDFTTSYTEHVTINVKGDSRKAKLKFFVPKITFVESETSLTPKNSDPVDYTSRTRRTPYDFYLIALYPDTDSPCGDVCNNIKLSEGSQLSKGVRPDSNMRIINGRATITVMSELVFQAPDFAKLHVTGPNASLMQAQYTNLQFLEPPVPTPVIADIFDVHGELPSSAMNIPEKYFSMQTEYLDGIGDSIAIYYYRNFHKDSLPEKIAVFWDEDDKDSVVFEKAEIATGATCGAAAGLDDTLCAPRITLSGKKLSKNVKTAGKGKIKSWATYMFAGQLKTSAYDCTLYDRIAPVIVSARAMKETLGGVELAKLKIEFSEPVQKTTEGVAKGDAVLSFYINNGKEPQFTEYIPLNGGSSIPATTNSNVMNLLYSPSSLFPQSGDYIHFGSIAGVGLFTDQSDYDKVSGTDTLRPADDATFKWNVAPGYDASIRRPSPWVLISGEVNSYAVRLIPSAMGGIPKTPSEAAKYDPFEVVTYDASKDDDDFRADIRAGKGENLEKYGYIPHGWYVKTDMGALIESREDYVNADKKNVFFDYELSFFTNLGAHVATNKGRIFCDDDKNYSVNGKYYFGGPGHNCVENRKNFYILWNMKSNKNRLVGSGAYISKLKTYVQLDNHGKKNKFEKREMWGVRHNAKTTGSFPAIKLNP